jgi:hypothetical protein
VNLERPDGGVHLRQSRGLLLERSRRPDQPHLP